MARARGDATGADALLADAIASATEPELNAYGYELLQGGKSADAIEVFRRNLREHPESWNAHDSLGEALAAKGDKTGALAEYRQARKMVKDETNQKRIDGILAGLEGTK